MTVFKDLSKDSLRRHKEHKRFSFVLFVSLRLIRFKRVKKFIVYAAKAAV